uniref:TEP1-F n=2 Tax=Anopheles atroparvus TaxID=41427 RepID=A0AAG5D6V6_ANOAO
MKCCVRSLVPLLVVFGICHGMLIIGPNKFRSNQKYTLVVCNFNHKRLDLLITMEGTSESNGKSALDLTRLVDVRQHTNKIVDFHIPDNLPQGSYKLTFQGQRGLSYLQEVPLSFESKSISGLIQINKPVFKPGDTVLFRVVVLNTELKPPVNVKTVKVVITDPHGNVIRRWSADRLHVGVFENKLKISPVPLLGAWTITVHADGEDILVSKQFDVKEYVLSTFDVEVIPSTIPLEEHQGLDLTVSANYFFGKPVKGTAILDLYLEDDILDQSKRWEIHGTGHAKLNFKEPLNFEEKLQPVRVNLTFIEQFTNRTVTKQQEIQVYKHMYNVELVTERQQFRPEIPFKCEIRLKYHDGKPAKNVAVQLTVEGLDEDLDENLTSDRNGIIRKTFLPSSSTTNINIMAAVDGHDLLNEEITRNDITTDAYVKVELKSIIRLNKLLKLSVKCSQKMSFLVYYVVSRGQVIDTGYIKIRNIKTYHLQIMATANMMPKSKIILATLAHETLIYDTVDILFDDMLNNFKVYIQNKEVKPATEINLDVRGPPGSYVALAAYDESLLQHNTNHDVLWEDIVKLFNHFHLISDNEYDPIHSMGLFARAMDNIQIEGASGQFQRAGWQSNHAETKKLVAYRTNFLESWLWQNVTMAASGRLAISEIAPDTTTSWYVTGFAIHPVYGMGIIKKPIQITTVQPFYIVENLPYSIKRGEAVALQFTLFNNLAQDHTATVKMYNVANQTEFIECSEVLSCTKSASVPALAGKPVSFFVKSRKLGEMVVRVKATITHDVTDAIEKVIRVMPDSLVKRDMESRYIGYNSYSNETFRLTLNIDKRADAGSPKIIFSLYPDLLTPVSENLENLLSVPTGSGEGNMIHFVPNVAVLDYLTARDVKNEQMINKATGLLRQGYQNQMKYRQADGSFGVWQNKGGSVFLTAFVANALQSASKYIPEVDIAMIATAFQWLAAKQSSSGHFVEVGSIIHQDLQGGVRNGIALTSYVLIAFMENKNARQSHGSVITKGIQYVNGSLPEVTDIYDRSIATYALALHKSTTPDIINKLIEQSTDIDRGKQRYWSRESHSVETTAYALLALLQAGRYIDGIPIMHWLVNQRHVTGSFPRTQDTFVGLKALTKLSEKITSARNDYTIQLRNPKTKQLKTYRIAPENAEALTVDIPSDVRILDVNVAGQGFGFFDVQYEYTVDMLNFNHRFNLTVEQFTYDSNYELKLKVCASFIPQLINERSNMALVEVNFPSGYVVDNDPITNPTGDKPIRKIEIRFGATSVVVYYDNMDMGLNCFTITAYRRFHVALSRPAHVLVHDFHEKEKYAIKVYNVQQQNVCDIC